MPVRKPRPPKAPGSRRPMGKARKREKAKPVTGRPAKVAEAKSKTKKQKTKPKGSPRQVASRTPKARQPTQGPSKIARSGVEVVEPAPTAPVALPSPSPEPAAEPPALLEFEPLAPAPPVLAADHLAEPAQVVDVRGQRRAAKAATKAIVEEARRLRRLVAQEDRLRKKEERLQRDQQRKAREAERRQAKAARAATQAGRHPPIEPVDILEARTDRPPASRGRGWDDVRVRCPNCGHGNDRKAVTCDQCRALL